MTISLSNAFPLSGFVAFGTRKGLLRYRICVPCSKRLPTVRDAFSEALRAQNRLFRYGMNCWDTGALRNYLAEGTANDAEVTTCIPDYISVCGLDLQSYQIYARCILLDTRTGYRSQYLAVSGILDL